MAVWIDGDGCPVVGITAALCKRAGIPCFIVTDTAHDIYREGAKTILVDKGADSVDLAIANRVRRGDIVITQDYGVASMCLGKGASVLHQDGWAYHRDNIEALLFSRYESRKYRAAGGRTKGPKKRTQKQNEAFSEALLQLLQQASQG